MAKVLTASLVIFAVLAGWVWVQRTYTDFARRNPRLGPFRQEGCGSCTCGAGSCRRQTLRD